MARIVQYQSIALVATIFLAKQGGGFTESPVVFAAPFSAAQQQFSFAPIQPRGTDPPNAEVNWQTLNPEVFSAPFPASSQQYDAMPWQGIIPTAPTPQGWYPQPPDVFAKPFPATVQQYDAAPWQGLVPTPPHAEGWEGWQLEAKFATPFPAASQQFQTFTRGSVPVSGSHGYGGYRPDYAFIKPFPVQEQQFFPAFQPQGFIKVGYPEGWRGHQWDAKFAALFPASSQQFLASFEPQGAVRSKFPEGWRGHQFDYAFAKPTETAAQQQFLAYVRFVIPPNGWWGQQYDYLFAAKFPVVEQQFQLLFEPQGSVHPAPNGWFPCEPTWAFAKPFPVASQQWDAFQPRGFIFTPTPPPALPTGGAGKRKNLPVGAPGPAYDAKPNKPYRPVWDKPKDGEAERHPVPLPPAGLFGQAPLPPAGLFNAAKSAPPPLALPDFKQFAPHDASALDAHMRDVQDQADIMAVLRSMGIVKDQG